MGTPADRDYTLCSALPAESVQVRFAGTFEGRRTTWDMELQTLAHWRRNHGYSDDGLETAAPDRPTCGVIEVGPEHAGARELMVALNVGLIDLPTLRKALVMIRNYRRLRPGRHAWGDDPDTQDT